MRVIRSDPSSAIAAAVEGWDRPVSRLELLIMDLWDLTAAAAAGGKKAPTYPRDPWKVKTGEVTRRGDNGGRTSDQVLELLRPA